MPAKKSLLGAVGLALLSTLAPGCAEEFDTSRTLPKRGTVGQEIYGVLCDRVGAQALREDLTGASFRDICHRPPGAEFADTVDVSLLPEIRDDAVDEQGKPVSVAAQKDARDKAIGRVEALGRRRRDLIRAFDATFPDVGVAIKDIDNPDETKSCNAPKKSGEAPLPDELARMLGKFGDLYNDGTLPQSTQSLARVIDAFKQSDEGQAAWSRISARQGYRPIETALGPARPIVAYPNLRDLSNASLRLLSADSNPYELDPKRDGDGARIPVPGPGNAALNKLLEAAHEELLAVIADPVAPPLAFATDAATGRVVLSRPRETLEMLEPILFLSDPAFGAGSTPRYIVRRDRRGYAMMAGGTVLAPFVDADRDGLPDVDEVGRFKTSDGTVAPSPFPYPGGVDGVRDNLGRSVLQNGQPFYEYLDTTKTFAAQALADLKPLVNPDPAADHETLMHTLGGLYVAMGPRTKTSKTYASGKVVEYEGVDVKASPMLDLVHAMSVILSDRNTEATLQLAKELLTKKEPQMARITGALSTAFDVAQAHPEAKIPKESTFWDENLDAMAKMAKEPGLLEDLLKALADPATAQLGTIFASYAKYRDEVSYKKNDINGGPFNVTTGSASEMKTPVDRNAPLTGKNRSALYRFLSLINDTMGVTACNRPDAKVHAELAGFLPVTMPLAGSYKECEAFKIDNLGAFYLDAIAQGYQYDPAGKPNKRGAFYLRDDTLRTGILGIGAATVSVMEDSSGLTGFWTTGTTLAPKPEWLNRLVFFDIQGDTVNTKTKRFIVDLQGEHIGTSVCPERAPFADPKPSAPDASPDKMVRGLRNCPEGLWLDQRGKNTIFTWENFGFYDAIRPLLGAFVKHGREDLFLELASAAFRHMPGADATADECRVSAKESCKRENGVSYEPLMIEALAGDVLPALTELAKALESLPITKCVASDSKGACTQSQAVSGIDVAAAATRALLEPDYARSSLKLTDRNGIVTAKRNDGTTNPQTTPAYLLTSALSGIDAAFDAYEAQTQDTKRRASWRKARSQLVDQFLGVRGAKITSTFTNPAIAKVGPLLVDLLRAQLIARCPTSFTPPYDKCAWARDELTKKATESLAGPLVSSGLEMMDAIRKDDEGRRQVNLLLSYLVDAASQNDALASMLASANDLVQVMRDDANIVPLLHVVASAMDASVRDPKTGKVVHKSLIDAQTALLARLSGKYFDREGRQICAREVDPNQVLSIALGKLVTPIKDDGFKGQTPLEVIVDVIADVNRVDPTQPYEGTLQRSDYGYVADQVFDFLSNKERGMEQFYEVIRQGTRF